MQNRLYHDGYMAPETVEWLKRRAATLFPDRRVERVRFEWYREQLRFTAGKVDRARKPLGVREVEL